MGTKYCRVGQMVMVVVQHQHLPFAALSSVILKFVILLLCEDEDGGRERREKIVQRRVIDLCH